MADVTQTTGDPTLETGRTASAVCAAAGRTFSGQVFSPHIPDTPGQMDAGKTYAVKLPDGNVLLATYAGNGVVDYLNPRDVR